jgi:mannose-6-phosphate isomerase
MHMLEALIAWVQAGGGAPFRDRANEIVTLALDKLIDPRTGAVGEYYDGDWAFAADPDGSVREPGHQFEWAYLLDLAGHVLGGDHRAASLRLEAFGAAHGIDPARKVAVFALDADGRVTNPDSRLWAQTERLRTAIILGARADGCRRPSAWPATPPKPSPRCSGSSTCPSAACGAIGCCPTAPSSTRARRPPPSTTS